MPQVRWSRFALKDLGRLREFLASHSDEASKRAVRAIRDGVKRLAKAPRIGKPVDDLPDDLREWVIPFGQSAYIVLYRLEGKQVVILAVRHGREAGY